MTDKDRIDRGDIRLRTTDEGPALIIGGTQILLRTFVRVEDPDAEFGNSRTMELPAEIDCDGDNGCWFDLIPEEDEWPWVTIQPEVSYVENDSQEGSE